MPLTPPCCPRMSKEWAAAFLPVLRLAMESFEGRRVLECMEELDPREDAEELDPWEDAEELDPNNDAEYWNELSQYEQGAISFGYGFKSGHEGDHKNVFFEQKNCFFKFARQSECGYSSCVLMTLWVCKWAIAS